MTVVLSSPPRSGRGDAPLAERLAQQVAARIDAHALRPGTRLPSIREAALLHGVSRVTVVEAYDRLVARGLVESRRGSGFYVRSRTLGATPGLARAEPSAPIDVSWLLDSMLRQMPGPDQPGAGLLPPDWLDADLVGGALRAVGRQNARALLGYGEARGHAPLRRQLAIRLEGLGIAASPEQILTTAGVTHAIDLVARHFVAPGDTVLVEDPGWFMMFGRLAAHGARVVGVPRTPDGPDIEALEALLAVHRPKLFILSSVLQNPSSTSISAAKAYALLRLAESHDFAIVDDDIYGDLHSGGGALRLAALDQLRRTVYLGGFSKSLAPSLRVGYLAAAPALAARLTELKMLSALTTPELGERVVLRVLADGQYRRHCERVRAKLAAGRELAARRIESLGLKFFAPPAEGLFLWTDCGCDTNRVAAFGAERGLLFAPGVLFSPSQQASTWMRLSAACGESERVWDVLAEALAKA